MLLLLLLGNFNAACGFLMLFYAVYTEFGAVLQYSYPSYPPLVMALVFSSNKSVINKEE